MGGAPGIGKSTLMLQICGKLCRFAKVLYVSGEESQHQLKLRAQRLHVESENLLVLSETGLGEMLEAVNQEQPDVLIVDSIQTLYNDALDSPAGSVSQVKDCTMALMQLAKGSSITVFVIGHVNKEGSIAGPRSWSIWWTVSCTSRGTGIPSAASSGRRRTALGQPMKSASLRWGTAG